MSRHQHKRAPAWAYAKRPRVTEPKASDRHVLSVCRGYVNGRSYEYSFHATKGYRATRFA